MQLGGWAAPWLFAVGWRQGDGDAERGALTWTACNLDAAAHPVDDPPRDGETEPGAGKSAIGAAIGLLEFVEDARLLAFRNADAGVAHRQHGLARARAGLDHDTDAAGFRELDGVAGEIEQHLPQPRGIADDALRQAFVDVGGDLQALRLRARTEQLDHVLDQRAERERLGLELDAAGLDLGKVENLFDQDSSDSPDVRAALT